jgi:anti-sigma-K factor RskA
VSDIHALSGAYAVDALDDLERERFERHLAECAECRAEVDSLREAGATLAETSTTTPPAALRESVLSGISAVRPLPPMADSAPASRRRFPLLVAAAAAVTALLGAGLLVAQPWEEETSQQLTAAERVVQAADARSFTVQVEAAEATLFVSDSLGQAALVTEDMPALPDDQVYELWLQKDGSLVAAGLMTDPDDPFLLDGDTEGATAAGMTIEPAGGSPRPTPPIVALFPFAEAT